jgi:hypothetical protein
MEPNLGEPRGKRAVLFLLAASALAIALLVQTLR